MLSNGVLIGGLAEMLVGDAMIAAGAGLSAVGIGIPLAGAGALVFAHGADVTSAGLQQAFTGESTQTITGSLIQGGLESMGASEHTAATVAGWIDMGISIIGTAGGFLVLKAPGVAASVSTAGRAGQAAEAERAALALRGLAAEGSMAGRVGAPSKIPSQVLSGHGWYDAADGFVTVPKGTSVTVWAEHGQPLLDSVGGLVDQGIAPAASDVIGARSYLPGASMPNYTLFPPDASITIMGNPTTVTSPTTLNLLLRPNQGNVWWSACQSLKP